MPRATSVAGGGSITAPSLLLYQTYSHLPQILLAANFLCRFTHNLLRRTLLPRYRRPPRMAFHPGIPQPVAGGP